MQKIIYKILNIITILLVIANLISYQFILPVSQSRAEEETGGTVPETTTVVDSGSSGTDTTAEEEEEAVVEETVEPDVIEGAEGTNTTDTTDTTNTTEVTDETETLPAVLPVTNNLTENNIAECTCKDVENYEYLEEDCDKNYPDDCLCFIDYCKGLVSENVTEDSSNAAVADSTTGGNAIENPAPDTVNPITDTPTTAEDTNNSSENNNNDNNNSTSAEEENQNTTDENQAIINAGDAAAQVSAVNAVNTNIYTENGVEIVQNITGDYAEDINLLETFDNLLTGAQNLNEENKQVLEQVVVTNFNIAKDVENSAIANADSGNNTIKNADGSASIVSGSATAVVSAVNLINTNIVGNNWLFAIINIVGNWTGDLIVPGEGLLKTPAAGLIFDKIVNINIANNIRNFLLSGASTGNNSIESAGGSANIQTGDALASTNGANFVNTNITSNNWFFLMINNAGNWTGKVINWDGDTGQQSTIYEYEFGSLGDGCTLPACAQSVSVYNYNYAENVENMVMANAGTGNNSISGSGDSSITTGNAGAWASAINFVNTNIIGNNWMFGIVNNSGNWSGDVVFGYPDLSVTLTPDKDQISPGDKLTYTVTYKNIGQAKCANADLMLSLSPYLAYRSGNDSNGSDNNIYWSAAGLKPGEERSFQVKTQLISDVPASVTELESAAGVKTETAEKDLSNNLDSTTVNIAFPSNENLPSEITITDDEAYQAMKETDIGISRSDDAVVAMGNITTHYIYVKNSGKSTLYNILATEKIKDPSGKKAAEYSWAIPELKKGQQAVINYQIFMGPQAQLGIYKHSAVAVGYNEFGYGVESKKAKGETNLVAGTSAGYVSGENQEIIPPAETTSSELPQEVLGVEMAKTSIPWGWLFLLLLAPIAYFIKKRELYRWQTLQRLASRAAGFLSSFLS